MQMLPTDLAYLVGLFDGVGTFSIQVNVRQGSKRTSVHFNPRMTMTLSFGREVLHNFVDLFGGSLYSYPDADRWCMGVTADLITATHLLLPYLRVKKGVAARFLQVLEKFPEKRNRHSKGDRTWSLESALEVAEVALTLNQHGSGKSAKKLEDVQKKIREVYSEQGSLVSSHTSSLTLNGETLIVSEWAKRLGVSPRLLSVRLNRGWSVERTLTEGF